MTLTRFSVPLYEQAVIVAIGTPDEVKKWILRTFDTGDDWDSSWLALSDGAAMGYNMKKDNTGRTVIYLNAKEMATPAYKESRLINTATHEIFHANAKMLEAAEVAYDPENHESHAYLMGWMCAKVLPTALKAWASFKKERVKI